jgi:hypothetical protein
MEQDTSFDLGIIRRSMLRPRATSIRLVPSIHFFSNPPACTPIPASIRKACRTYSRRWLIRCHESYVSAVLKKVLNAFYWMFPSCSFE